MAVASRTSNLLLNIPCETAVLESYQVEKTKALRKATYDVFKGQPLSVSENELYEMVLALCSHGCADGLFKHFKADLDTFTVETISETIFGTKKLCDVTDELWKQTTALPAEEWLCGIRNLWRRHCDATSRLRQIFCSLDANFVRLSDAKSIRNLSLSLFRHYFVTTENAKLVSTTFGALLNLVKRERQGGDVDAQMMKSTIDMLGELELYWGAGCFEPALLSSTAAFYKAEADEQLTILAKEEYVRHARKRLEEEERRVLRCLKSASLGRIVAVCLDVLVDAHKEAILDHSFALATAEQSPSNSPPKRAAHEDKTAGEDVQMVSASEVAPLTLPIAEKSRDGQSPSSGASQDFVMDRMILQEDLYCLSTYHVLFTKIDQFVMLKGALVNSVQRQIWRLLRYYLAGGPAGESPSSSSSSAAQSTDRLPNAPDAPIPNFKITASRDTQRLLIPAVIELRQKIDRALQEAFGNSDELCSAAQGTIQEALNSSTPVANVTAQLLARYCDDVLRLRAGKVPHDEVDASLSDIITTFRCLQSKDYFEAFYKKDLGKRLLLSRSASHEAERLMVKKLRDECGNTFTSKLEGMFKELEVSKSVFQKFVADKTCRQKVRAIGVDFECHVFANSIWPHPLAATSSAVESSKPSASSSKGQEGSNGSGGPEMTLPPEASALQAVYADFYTRQHDGRVLQWSPALGSCVIRARFPKAIGGGEGEVKHDLVVSQIQGVALLLFNDHETLSVSDIQRATGADESELHRQLLALCVDPKKRILRRIDRKASAPNPSDQYCVNTSFSSKLTRIVVTQIQLKESKAETQATELRVEENRSYHLDAAIVRIMKASKKIHHTQLISRLFEDLRFKTSPQSIKQRIESLIDREFMERNKDDPQTYDYVA